MVKKRDKGKKQYSDILKKLKLPQKNMVLVPAALWKRIFAFFIDLLIIEYRLLGIKNF